MLTWLNRLNKSLIIEPHILFLPTTKSSAPKLKSRSPNLLLTFNACFQLCWRCWSELIKFWLLVHCFQFRTISVNAEFRTKQFHCHNKLKSMWFMEKIKIFRMFIRIISRKNRTHDFVNFKMIVLLWILNIFKIIFMRNLVFLSVILYDLQKLLPNRFLLLAKSCQRPIASMAIRLRCTIGSRVCSVWHLCRCIGKQ